MSKYPRISKGLGKLTPELWNRLMRCLKFFETRKVDLEGLLDTSSGARGVRRPYFPAVITGSAQIDSDKRYKYSWKAIGLEADADVDSVSSLSGSATGDNYALNLCEMNNTATDVAPGVNLAGADYPAGYSMQPIKNSPVVIMFVVREWKGDDEGKIRYVFSMANAHDGSCS